MNCQIGVLPGDKRRKSTQKDHGGFGAFISAGCQRVRRAGWPATCHRDNLYPLKPFDKKGAEETVRMVEEFGDRCLKKCGSKIFFSSDELYIKGRASIAGGRLV